MELGPAGERRGFWGLGGSREQQTLLQRNRCSTPPPQATPQGSSGAARDPDSLGLFPVRGGGVRSLSPGGLPSGKRLMGLLQGRTHTEKEGLGGPGLQRWGSKGSRAPSWAEAVAGGRIAAAPGRAGRTQRASPGPFFLRPGSSAKGLADLTGPIPAASQPPTPDPISQGNRRLPGISETVSSLHRHHPTPAPIPQCFSSG